MDLPGGTVNASVPHTGPCRTVPRPRGWERLRVSETPRRDVSTRVGAVSVRRARPDLSDRPRRDPGSPL